MTLKLAYEQDAEWVRLEPPAGVAGLEWLREIELHVRAVARSWFASWSRRYDLAVAKERSRSKGTVDAALTLEGAEELDGLYLQLLHEAVLDARGFERRGAAVEDLQSVGLTAHAVRAALAFQAPTPRQRDCLPGSGEPASGGP